MFQQNLKGNIQSVAHEKVCHIPNKKHYFSNLLDNCGRNIKLDQNEFIDMGSLSRDSGFNVLVQGLEKGLTFWLVG